MSSISVCATTTLRSALFSGRPEEFHALRAVIFEEFHALRACGRRRGPHRDQPAGRGRGGERECRGPRSILAARPAWHVNAHGQERRAPFVQRLRRHARGISAEDAVQLIFVEPGAQTFKWRGHIVSAPRREWSWQVTATWFLAEEDFAEELRISEFAARRIRVSRSGRASGWQIATAYTINATSTGRRTVRARKNP